MSEPKPAGALRIGDCVLHARSHELQAPGREIQRLPKRLVELLLLLAAHPGQVLSRQQLLDEVWQRRMVADEVLSRAIADLRVALGDDARAPRYIETIPKTGYRLVAEVQALPGSAALAEVHDSAREPKQAEPWLPSVATTDVPPPQPPRFQLWMLLSALLLVVGGSTWWLWQNAASADSLRAIQQRLARASPLTSDAHWEMHPATSADGVWLAYARSTPFSAQRQIHLRHLEHGDDRVWAAEAGSNDSPAFSPDGSELVYRHCAASGAQCQWRRRSARGGDWQVLGLAHAQAPGADWSKLGIVAVLGDAQIQAPKGLAWLPVATGQDWVMLSAYDSDAGLDQLPRWIPGTRTVAVLRHSGLLDALYTLELDAPQRRRRIAMQDSRIQDHRWRAADEAWLSSDLSGFRALLRWREGSAPDLLGARGTRGVALLPQGGAVLDLAEYDSNVHQLRLSDPQQPAALIEVSTRSEGHPALSPDGRWLALVSLREGSDQIWLQDLHSGVLRRVSPLASGTQAVRPAFSADARVLYFTVYSERGIHAWSYDLQRGTSVELTALGNDVFALQPSSVDGEFVWARHNQDATLQLWRSLPGATQDRSERIELAAGVQEFVVEQRQLWWLSRGASDWQGLALDSGQPLQRGRPATATDAQLWCWTLNGGAMYAVYSDGILYRHAPDATDWQALGPIASGAAPMSMAVHAGSDRLLLARTDRIAVDLFRVPAQR